MNNHTTSTPRDDMLVMASGLTFGQRSLVVGWQQPDVQAAFRRARDRFGHVLCMCRPSPLKLQVRLRDAVLHLAVWPHEGPRHDTECIFFRDAISDPLTAPDAPKLNPLPSPAEPPSTRADYLMGPLDAGTASRATSVRTFAMQLWERAALCRWHPSWSRDWGRTRFQLLQAAHQVAVNGVPFEQLLFVPRPYRETEQSTLNAHWDQFVRSLAVDRPGMRVLIAPLRRFVPASTDKPGVVYLRHLRAPIGLSTACHDFIQRECRNALRSLRLQGEQQAPAQALLTAPEIVGVFVVESSSRGGVWARAGWLIAVHPRVFIPALNPEAVTLIDKLIADGHAFQHLPSDAPSSRRAGPDWLVRHVLDPQGRPVARAALEILDRGSGLDYMRARAALAQRLSEQGIPTWTWVPSGPRSTRTVPPLPPSDQRPGTVVLAELQQIHTAADADYRFGPSSKFTLTERKAA